MQRENSDRSSLIKVKYALYLLWTGDFAPRDAPITEGDLKLYSEFKRMFEKFLSENSLGNQIGVLYFYFNYSVMPLGLRHYPSYKLISN
jgi:hypothetical protein